MNRPPDAPGSTLLRLKSLYATTAIIWLTTSVLALLVVAAYCSVIWIEAQRHTAVKGTTYSASARVQALHNSSPADAMRLFVEFDNLNKGGAFRYRPWVDFSERPFSSQFLNIDDAYPLPIRRTIPPTHRAANKKTIWLFGGSTQFGWGVPDSQTIASHLSAILSTDGAYYDVINHGHTYFYSTQESTLFSTLLRHDQKCDIAVFLDGLNDIAFGAPRDVPHFTDETAAGFLKEQGDAAGNSVPGFGAPFSPVVSRLRRLFGRSSPASKMTGRPPDLRNAGSILKTYRFNISEVQGLADRANIKLALFWQPTPYDYLIDAEECRRRSQIFDEMPRLNVLARQTITNKSFHFIADLFSAQTFDDAYVDDVHYGDIASRAIAEAIATNLANDGLLR